MTRYFFHIRDGEELIGDEEGVELRNEEAARGEADRAARDLLIDQIKQRRPLDHRRFEVWDEDGVPLFILPIRSVIGVE